jgi:hypothetical protein
VSRQVSRLDDTMKIRGRVLLCAWVLVPSGCSSTYWHDAYWEHQRRSGYFQDLTDAPDACKEPLSPDHVYKCSPDPVEP